MYVPLSRFLLRAPLLPIAALPRARRALAAHPLGAQAIANASPSLAGARAGGKREGAVERYARRAAFRATPAGLLAGVCMGRLGRTTAVATGSPRAYVTPSWARMDALARSLLDDPEIRERTRVRVAPSAMSGANVVRWICPAEPFAEEGEAVLDERLTSVMRAAEGWTTWGAMRSAASDHEHVHEHEHVNVHVDVDDFLLTLVDSGLLQSDLAPPLVGGTAVEHVRSRLAALGRLDAVQGELEARVNDHAVLVHQPRAEPTLDRAAVERAARLIPLLIGLQEALAEPAAERFNQQGTADALDAITESYGSGAFDLAALAAGDYGVQVADGDGELSAASRPSAPVIGVFVDAIAAAIAQGSNEARLDPQRLAAAVPALGPPHTPPTAELFVVPSRPRPRTPPGTGWLLGLHAPAGASFGRFAHALGPAMGAALTELDAAEREVHQDIEHVDVAFAPSPALADLCAYPRTRRRTLALSRWGTDAADDLAPGDLELVADPAAPEALALRARPDRTPIVPAPLSRVRSTAAPAGVSRLLVAWSLQRQYAPWALPLGPFGEVAFLPRLTLDGFVIAPASWRVPERTTPRAFAHWRRTMRLPRIVQIGDGDELLPVDLAAPDARRALVGRTRVFEIWPPLDDVVDRDGRRLEAVVMLVDRPDAAAGADLARHAAAVRAAEPVPPPHRAPPALAWRTFKLFGAEAFQDDLLLDAVAPAVQEALRAREIEAWFFLRYIDGPGRRPHLRLRVRSPVDPSSFERRLTAALEPARARATLTTIETADYHAERGRFRPGELDAVHAIFEADSEFACQLLADRQSDDALERITFAVRAFDALAEGMGLAPEAREALARSRRAVTQADNQVDNQDERLGADLAFRACSKLLQAVLHTPPDAHIQRIARAAQGLSDQSRLRLLPDLLHLSAVRLMGADRNGEHLAYVFWERTLEGLRKRGSAGSRRGRSGFARTTPSRGGVGTLSGSPRK